MPTELKVLMFTDQVDSTQRTVQRTITEMRQVIRANDELTAEVVCQCHGTILKDTGDGVFSAFVSCGDAVQCGAILQQRVKAWNEAQTNDRLQFDLHIGIDSGEVLVLPNGDVRGNAANRAARVCSQCPAGSGSAISPNSATRLHLFTTPSRSSVSVPLPTRMRKTSLPTAIPVYRPSPRKSKRPFWHSPRATRWPSRFACAYMLEARENDQSLVATIRQAEDDIRSHLPTGW